VAQTLPGYDVTSFAGLAATGGTPRAVIARLNRELHAVLALPEINKRLLETGGDVRPSSPEEMGRHVAGDIAKVEARGGGEEDRAAVTAKMRDSVIRDTDCVAAERQVRITNHRITPLTKGETMKILYFDDFKLGVLKGDSVVDVSAVVKDIPHTGPHNLISGLIERFADYRAKLEKAVADGKGVPVSSVRIRPPLPKPVTYRLHGRQLHGRRYPQRARDRSTPFTRPRAPSSATATPWCCRTYRPPCSKAKRNSRW
jgi:hypothetical protein